MGERRHARILSLPLVDDWIRTAVTPQVDVWAFFHAILLVRYNVYYVKLLMSTEPLEREGLASAACHPGQRAAASVAVPKRLLT